VSQVAFENVAEEQPTKLDRNAVKERVTDPESAPGQPDDPAGTPSTVQIYSLSPRRVAMFAVSAATASLTALAVVASVEGAEALTTIALVLAIVAFTIQIFLFVVQSQAASEQRVRSEQLNTQTRALLTEVRTTAQVTQAMVTQQFDQLLQAFVTGAAQTAQETKFDPVSFEQRLMSNIRLAAQQPAGGVTTSPSASGSDLGHQVVSPPPRSQRDQARRATRQRSDRPARLRTFPAEDEGRQAVAALRDLSATERGRLRDLAEDEIGAAASGSYIGLYPEIDDLRLEELNLVGQARVELGDSELIVVRRLTDEGAAVARLLTALGEIPPWARDLPDVRSQSDGVVPDDDIPF
jgi:hypothetical protein